VRKLQEAGENCVNTKLSVAAFVVFTPADIFCNVTPCFPIEVLLCLLGLYLNPEDMSVCSFEMSMAPGCCLLGSFFGQKALNCEVVTCRL
jgi:hypothetical protein